ncbi:MAG TPA: cytochrome P450 [Streptosporangiaceae bacterium]|nr:cytochrome P450 [Streptosporangiaceae bacterium]
MTVNPDLHGPGRAAPPQGRFPVGAAVTRTELEGDLHPALARLRAAEPVSWLPVLGGWLVTRRDLALRVLRDSKAFTVDDPRFTTAQVVGPSMLSLDGPAHDRHRKPFSRPFSQASVDEQFAGFVTGEAERLVTGLRPAGAADLRRGLAGPLAVAVMARALGLGQVDPAVMLAWYDAIVGTVSGLAGNAPAGTTPQGATPAGDGVGGGDGAAAFQELSEHLLAVMRTADGTSLLAHAVGHSGLGDGHGLEPGEVVSDAAVLMFGGIETTEGMITNALLHLLSHPGQLRLVTEDPALLPNAIEESLRLEPAAAVVDRYATSDVTLGDAGVRKGDLVTVSLAGAGRDPAVFADPDRFDARRENARLNLAFAHGPHFCIGAYLARLQTLAAVSAALRVLPRLRVDDDHRSAPRGLVFRKPPQLNALWDVAQCSDAAG